MTMAATQLAEDRVSAITVLPALPDPSASDEANHRIANSLQLLAAMISIEARTVHDPAGLAVLDVTQRRINAIAGVHRQLCKAPGQDAVDLADYLVQLGGELELACAHAAGWRRVLVDARPLVVAAEDATAIGIIVSELVANACKYAYAGDEPGDIEVVLRPGLFGGYQLEVADRGRGLGDTVHGSGIGTRLVQMMAARLGGTCAYHDAQPGTRFVLTIGAN